MRTLRETVRTIRSPCFARVIVRVIACVIARGSVCAWVFCIAVLTSMVAALWQADDGRAREATEIPNFRDPSQRMEAPRPGSLRTIRFITSADYPPFNFLDRNDDLSGFNVDLARAICAALNLPCTIQSYPFRDLAAVLNDNRGDVILAGIAITQTSREKFDFSRSYMRFPARFVMRVDGADKGTLPEDLKGARIGVIARSAHEAYLGTYFHDARIMPFRDAEAARAALRGGAIDFLFGDGMRLGFWLYAQTSQGCCRFVGGPYMDAAYFGEGMAAAVRKGDRNTLQAIDYALQHLYKRGVISDLYLRYFPIGFF